MQAARVMLRYTPNDVFEMNFSADITDEDDTSPYELTNRDRRRSAARDWCRTSTASWRCRPTASPTTSGSWRRTSTPPTRASDDGRVDGGIETPNVSEVTHWGESATFDVNLDAVQIKLILAHREFDSVFGQDSDGSPLAFSSLTNEIQYDQDTVELRVSGELFGGRTTWTAGYFALDSLDFNSTIVSLAPCINATSCIDRVDAFGSTTPACSSTPKRI